MRKSYFGNLSDKLGMFKVTQGEQSQRFFDAIESAGQLAMSQSEAGKKIIPIENGASTSIASQMATDFWKNGGMRAAGLTMLLF